MPAVFYDEATYGQVKISEALANAVMYLSLGGFVLGLFTVKYIGVEMMGVVQLAFIGLISVDYLQPTLAPLSKIGFVNGVNTMFQNTTAAELGLTSLPNRITALQYEPAMAYTLNYTVALLILPFLISLILYLLSFAIKSKQ